MPEHKVIHVELTDVATHHFFAVDPISGDFLMVDPDRGVAVYTDRDRCMEDARAAYPDGMFGVGGMGDEKWALFQAEVPHHLVQ
jgi:hypothetical protein